ncbi:hypothetical protein HID58_072185, partial [Brassica napus]
CLIVGMSTLCSVIENVALVMASFLMFFTIKTLKRARAVVPRKGNGGDPDGNPSSPSIKTEDCQDEDDYKDEAEFDIYCIQRRLSKWYERQSAMILLLACILL